MEPVESSGRLRGLSFCMWLSCMDMMLAMPSDVASGMYMSSRKALVVVESIEYTPVRYKLSMRSGECLGESGVCANGL